ncbi:MAG TPA: dihydroorotate dehydrogenase electron transfer subunit [Patescibacteria group bacterium]|nr:dihydroorotate dehydrogenase electron transfer subunit [Patescibacteria group bacterium]
MSGKFAEPARVVSQVSLSDEVRRLTLAAPGTAAALRPGQFVHLKIADSYEPLLRRPFSVTAADPAAGTLEIIYRIVGKGTGLMAAMTAGDGVNCLGPLGNGFTPQGQRPLLVGGGMGLAPLLMLAGALCPRPVTVLMGGRDHRELFWTDLFAGVCHNTHITTDDGSMGRQGLTVDLLPELLAQNHFDMIYSCGPQPMLAAVARIAALRQIPCQVSLEDYMACGLGACLSCTCAGTDGKRRKVCTDGPVFWAGEVLA